MTASEYFKRLFLIFCGVKAQYTVPLMLFFSVFVAIPATAFDDDGLEKRTYQLDSLERTYEVFIPETNTPLTGLVIGLHGTGGSGTRFRYLTNRILESYARQEGWIVLYPNAYMGSWNDCRNNKQSPAKQTNIDDVGYLDTIVKSIRLEFGIRDVFYAGFSNGAHMAYRMLLEGNKPASAIAMIAAHVPHPDASLCKGSTIPRSSHILLVSGTKDPINPYYGGDVILKGARLGNVLSARESALHFIDSSNTKLEYHYSVSNKVTKEQWLEGEKTAVLYSLDGNGHVISGVKATYPDFVGPNESDFPVMNKVAEFFIQAANHSAKQER